MRSRTAVAPVVSHSAVDIVVWGFIAGFLATLLFHQLIATILYAAGIWPRPGYNWQPVPPFGVPQVLSLSFWAGLWGILLAYILARVPRGAGYWITAFVFGALAPTAVAWFVVAPLKGQPLGNGFTLAGIIRGLVINGVWGLGTAVLLSVRTLVTGRDR